MAKQLKPLSTHGTCPPKNSTIVISIMSCQCVTTIPYRYQIHVWVVTSTH